MLVPDFSSLRARTLCSGLARALAIAVLTLPVACGGDDDNGGGGAGGGRDSGTDGSGGGGAGDGSDSDGSTTPLPRTKGPSAVLTATALDFGRVDCGSLAQQRAITLRNDGDATLRYALQLPSSLVFALEGATSGELAPGAQIPIAVRATVAATTSIAPLTTTLVVSTNDAAHGSFEIPITATPGGGIVSLLLPSVAFPDVALGSVSADQPISLTNVGNEPVTVGFGAPTRPAFALAWTGAPGTVVLAPGQSVPALVARFTPAGLGRVSATVPIQVTGTQCAPPPPSVGLVGRGTNGALLVDAANLDFGRTPCGATSDPQTVSVYNNGNGPLDWTASLALGANSPYAIAPTSGTLAPGASAPITVTPKAVPAVASTAADLFADRLLLTSTAAGDGPQVVQLHQTARGAELAWEAASADLGQPVVGTDANVPLRLVNHGNGDVHVRLETAAAGVTVDGDFATSGPVYAASVATPSLSFAPVAPGAVSGTLTTSLVAVEDEVLCSPLPAPIRLSGAARASGTTVETTAIDFGAVPCASVGNGATLVIRNPSLVDVVTYSATLAGTSAAPYQLTSGSGIVPPLGFATITVSPPAIPAQSAVDPYTYADAIQLTTSVDPARTIPIRMRAYGAILEASTTGVAFGGVTVGEEEPASFRLRNTGSAPAVVSFDLTSPTGAAFAAQPQAASVIPRETLAVLLGYGPTAIGAHAGSATITVDPTTTLCAPLPPTVSLSGTGTEGGVQVHPRDVDFGYVACGATAPAQSVFVENVSDGAFDWSARLEGQGTAPFTITGTAGALAPGERASIRVTPVAVPATVALASLAPDSLRWRLVVETSIPGDAAHEVLLHETPRGAVLDFVDATGAPITSRDFGTVTPASTAERAFAVRNRGNLDAPFTLATSAPFDAIAGGSSVSASTAAASVALFTPSTANPASGTISVATTAPLCSALPAPLTVTGNQP